MSERDVKESTSSLFKNGRAIYPLSSPEDDWWLIIMFVIGVLTLIGYVVAYIIKGY